MCGICGFAGLEDRKLLEGMCEIISHRGPDDGGTFTDKDITLGHRRLSIIDLTTGRQPIHNEDESVWIVYNGEIYNFRELREGLEKRGHRFYTESDTEVIVHCYEEYGIDCVKKLNGIFAFAIWDSNKKELFLARDHLGVKPLYYTVTEGVFLFASEIKSILQYPSLKREVNTRSLNEFMCLSYVPGKNTMLNGIYKLRPAERLIYNDGKIRIGEYWSPCEKIGGHPEGYYVKKLRSLLEKSVKMQLISDVPLGAYLSGGIDSSTIVGLMDKFMDEPVKTFSVGFGENVDNELSHAKTVAEHFGTEHHEVTVDVDSLSCLPQMIWHYDELIGDSAIVPSYVISERAKKDITVVLAGEGSDEILGGYQWYRYALMGEKFASFTPSAMRRIMGKAAGFMSQHKIKKALNYAALHENLGEYYFNTHTLLDERDRKGLYSDAFHETYGEGLERVFDRFFENKWHFMNQMQLCDVRNLLAEDYLMKADKMVMAHSIEERVPFLNQEVVEFTFTLPINLKLKGADEKYILKKAMSDILPKTTLKRKKRGYGTPIEHWFTTEFGEAVHTRLMESATIKRYFNPEQVDRISLDCRRRRGYTRKTALLWNLLVLDIWHEIYIGGDGSRPGRKLF